jgi:hypothetical protein
VAEEFGVTTQAIQAPLGAARRRASFHAWRLGGSRHRLQGEKAVTPRQSPKVGKVLV